jgi:ABC-type antimicrobial peptide transport system, permease component
VLLSVLGVALAIGLMVSVTGIALGLASQSVVESDDVDYWIVPEDSSSESLVAAPGGVKLGEVHTTTRQIWQDDRVRFATPVLIKVLPINDATTGEKTYLLTVGVIPSTDAEVLGIATNTLTSGDPYYANGTYNGSWTGDLILNNAAATLTNTSTGMTVTTPRSSTNRTLTVVNVSAGGQVSVGGTVPVALMHLGELQSMSGGTTGDQANQILVSTTEREVKSSLADQYPQAEIVERSGLSAGQVSTSSLPLAVAVAALIAAVVVGVLFITTLMGIEVNANRQQLAMLAAIGFSRSSRSLLVAAETLVIALFGGIVGLGLGGLGIVGVNAFGQALLDVETTALFNPLLILYALAIAVFIGILGAVYPVVLAFRRSELEGLTA